MKELVGRTISDVHELEYGDVLLRFTDGSAVHVAGEGYEVEGVSFESADADALLAEEAARKREQEESVRRARALNAETKAKREELGPAEFLAWMDANRPNWRTHELMGRTLLPELQCELRAGHEMLTRTMNRQAYAAVMAEIPTKEPNG